MPGIDKATGRVATVLVLVMLAAIALRGYVPGGQAARAEPRTNSVVSLVAVVALLAVALAGIAFAVMTSPRRPVQSADVHFQRLGSGEMRVRLRWRWVLLAMAVILCWLLVVVLITRLTSAPDPPPNPPPTTSAPATPPAAALPPDPTPPDDGAYTYLAAATLILLLIFAFGTTIAARRRSRPAVAFDDGERVALDQPPAAPETLARAAELGLLEIGDLSRDPRAAIIACYAAMERGLAYAPGAVPQESDTPSEVLARAVQHHALSADSATELVELFTEARFSPHVMTENHREAAVQALHRVLAELRSMA